LGQKDAPIGVDERNGRYENDVHER
jgi:hypothetical protein